jgi:translocation and assembly module TamB
LIRLLAFLAMFIMALPALAQETPEDESSLFISFVENQLSGPNRQIRIIGIQGTLSSNARIQQITVADNEGVWLRINGASIDWSRTTLLLRQRLQISRLAADSIEVLRQPIPDESLPTPEASVFQIPELPIAVNLDALEVPSVSFGQTVFGLESEISVTGRLRLDGGSLDTALQVTRLDGPGGQLALSAVYDAGTETIDLDVNLSEPENGVVANLLNLDDRPPVELVLAGSGPLTELDVELALDAAGERILSGATSLRGEAEGIAFTADLRGPIAQLVPVRFRDFFGEETVLSAAGLSREAGGFRLDRLDVESAALTLSASAETGTDGFLTRLALDATIDDGSADPVILPVPGGNTTVERADIAISYGVDTGDEWSGTIAIDNLTTPDFAAARTEIVLSGLALNLAQPEARRVTFQVDGTLGGIIATRADIAEALGETITLDIDGEWNAGQPVRLQAAEIGGNGLAITLAGDIADYAFDGDIAVTAASIAPFSGMAGRELAGALELRASGEVRPVSGAFDLTIDSEARELRIGTEAADNLMDGTTTITGRVARSEVGLTAEQLRVANEQFELLADGTFASGAADFDYSFILSDLALVSPEASGRLEATGRAEGSEGLLMLTTVAEIATGRLAGKQLGEGRIAFEGTLQDGALDGTVGGSAFLDGVRVDLSAGIAVAEGARRLSDLSFTAGGANLTGAVTQTPSGLFEGALELRAADISTAAALLLVEASGAVNADLRLANDGVEQQASLSGSMRDLVYAENSVSEATFQAQIANLFGVPVIDGSIEGSDITAAGIEISRLTAAATRSGEDTAFDVSATLDNGAVAAARGSLAPEGGGYRLSLAEASLAQGPLGARLVEPASLLVQGETITFDGIAIDVGGGRVTAQGTIAETLNLRVVVADFPLVIANLVRPDLDLGGTVAGNATITGARASPDVAFSVQGRSITAAALRQAGQSSISLDATGTTAANRLNLDASVTSPEGLRATIRGSAPLGDGELALDVALAAFPLGALNAAIPGQALGGSLTGTARVSGPVADPRATFDLRAQSLTAAPLAAAGVAPLDATASGSFANQTITLASANVSGPQGLTLNGSGTIPLSGGGLSIQVAGQAPLALANQFLAERGTQVSGTLQLNASVSGSIDQPAINGNFSTAGAQVVDPETNVALRDITVNASIAGSTVTIGQATAALAAGGSISATGNVSIDAAAGFPADIRIALNQARYADGDLVVATVSGNLAITGALARDPLLSGNVNVDRAEITVPDGFGSGASAIDVIHRNPPPPVRATLERARANDGTPTPSARPSVLRLDLTINAPARIFVRGRGLDAELGGSVRLTGPITAIQPVGGFELIRGRLSILGQRITFDEGTVTLVGDLDPFINFVARSGGNDITVFITVSGRVSDPSITFSSQPQLPEDEVLARLIFNRGIGELSPLQIAQLAAAAAELAGGGNTSLLGSLRGATGLDDLDIVTDSEGNAAVRAGRYIQDNIYLGVEAGAQGSTRGTINLDITEELRARGAVGTDGDSSLGIFFERDY